MNKIKIIAIITILFSNLYGCGSIFQSDEKDFKDQFIKIANMTDNKKLQEEAKKFKYPHKKNYLKLIEENYDKKGENSWIKTGCYEENLTRKECLDRVIKKTKDFEIYKEKIITVTSDSNNSYYQDLLKRYPENKEQLKLLINNAYDYRGNVYQKDDTLTKYKTILMLNQGKAVFAFFFLLSIILALFGKFKDGITIFVTGIIISLFVGIASTIFGF